MKRLIILLLAAFSIVSMADAQLTLEQCQQKARNNYPLIRKYSLIEAARDYNIDNVSKGNLPQISISGKATYQSEVTKLGISLPNINIKSVAKDQYQAVLNVQQNMWDGGRMSSQKKVTEASAEIEHEQNNVDLYALNDRVNQLYFGILLLDEQLKQNQLLLDDLERNYKQIDSYRRNGIANEADIDEVHAEQLNAKQQRNSLIDARNTYINMLSLFIGEKVSADAALIKPVDTETSADINRPELHLLSVQEQQLKWKRQALDATLRPQINLIAQGGYGRPGLNMLDNDFHGYYLIGVQLSWNIGAFYTKKNDRALLNNEQSKINNARDVFLFNTNMQSTQQMGNIAAMRHQMQDDDEIIALRERICKVNETKLNQGTLAETEMLRMINAKDQARQTKALHNIQLLSDIYEMKYVTNNK